MGSPVHVEPDVAGIPKDKLAPFTAGAGDVGVLLVHGLSGTPYDMRALALHLVSKGLRVSTLRLAGHAQGERALLTAAWPDWWQSVVQGYLALEADCEHVVVAGQSLGGLLALHLAQHYPVSGAAALAAPLFLDQAMLRWVPWLKHVMRFRPRTPSDIRDPAAFRVHPDGGRQPLRAIESLCAFMRHVGEDLSEVRCPLLLIYSQLDARVPFDNMSFVASHVGSDDVRTVALMRSGHMLTVDFEHERVAHEIDAFVRRVAGEGHL